MNQTVARIFGVVFILVGVLGFFSGSMNMSAGMELGIFPVNVVHNLVHILIGVWGLMAARTAYGATAYCKQAGLLYLALAVLGFIPAIVDKLDPIVPIGGNDRFLHLVLAAILIYFGFMGEKAASAATA